MRRSTVFDSAISLEALDLRLSPSSLFVGGSHALPVCSARDLACDDPLPDPEPSPGTAPGSSAPITPPPLPPSGPIGPGTS
jgi:hypothetical protein